jgi:molecular chaperone DnaK (HSP70)
MTVAGIDYGNLNLLIGQTSKGGVDVILNDSSNRQTATAVSFQGKQRFIGDSGAAMVSAFHLLVQTFRLVLPPVVFVGEVEYYQHNHLHEDVGW